MTAKKLVLATRNRDKVDEIRMILKGKKWTFLSLLDFPRIPDITEDGESFRENALIKARTAHQLTGLPALSDDSGLEVDYLKGAPGIFSGRYAGEKAAYADNNRKLIREMAGVAEKDRTARFRCVAAYVDGQQEHCTEGFCEGIILSDYQEVDAFGYDPVFYVPYKGKTFAAMSETEKNAISHRGMAFRAMNDFLLRFS